MQRFAFFLWISALAAGCLVEDKPVTPPNDGGVDAGLCGTVSCPADRPVCNDERLCVECTADENDYCTEQGLGCDPGSSTCASTCSGDEDCNDPMAARCDDDVCKPCVEHVQCDGADGLDPMWNACDAGVCVDCTVESEVTTCPGQMACDPATKECTDVRVGGLDVCEQCVADNQCGDDGDPSEAFRCVEMLYDENRYPNAAAGYCLEVFSIGGCEQPYAIRISERESLSGDPLDSYCGINEGLATCPAVRALDQNVSCPEGEDTECPESGLCRSVGGLPTRCTYPCSGITECLENVPDGRPGSTCDSSGSGGAGGSGGDYCGG